MSTPLQLKLPNDLHYLPIAQAFIRTVAERIGFSGSALGQIELAAEESIANVIKHAFDEEESDTFEILCEQIPRGLRVTIKDKGIPFDPSQAPAYNPAGGVEDADFAGMGMFLIRSLVDECSFVNRGPEGKETVLIKYLHEDEESPVDAPQPRRNVAVPEVIKEKLSYDVRLMRDHEAIEVSRCAFKSHGYSFFDDHIYSPEKIVELNHSGQMISVVAVTKENVFMGHVALLYQELGDDVAELTFVFVNVEYRGQGIFNRMMEYLFSLPKPHRMDGLYAYAVANHVFTQKTMARYGINDCGIQVATSPESWKFKGIPGDPSQRISVVLSFKYLVSPQRLTLYPPAHHRAIVEKLYRNIGAEHDYVVPERSVLEGLSGPSDIHCCENETEGCVEIFIKQYGAEASRDLRRLLRKYCLMKMSSLNLFLPLQNPATFFLVEEIERVGFFFAGILPHARNGDTLILQYLNNVDLHYDKISAYSDTAKEILAYIRAHDPNENL